jgi:hypothetical protein
VEEGLGGGNNSSCNPSFTPTLILPPSKGEEKNGNSREWLPIPLNPAGGLNFHILLAPVTKREFKHLKVAQASRLLETQTVFAVPLAGAPPVFGETVERSVVFPSIKNFGGKFGWSDKLVPFRRTQAGFVASRTNVSSCNPARVCSLSANTHGAPLSNRSPV